MATLTTTPDGRKLRERGDIHEAGECADCGKHVDPGDPALYTRLANTGLEPRTDERGLQDDEELAVRGTSSSMGSETLDDPASTRSPAPESLREGSRSEPSVNADAATVWDGSCYHCGAEPGRVGTLANP